MTISKAMDYRASVESSEMAILSELDPSVVRGIYSKYGARRLEEVSDYDLPDLFNEMSAIESDLR